MTEIFISFKIKLLACQIYNRVPNLWPEEKYRSGDTFFTFNCGGTL